MGALTTSHKNADTDILDKVWTELKSLSGRQDSLQQEVNQNRETIKDVQNKINSIETRFDKVDTTLNSRFDDVVNLINTFANKTDTNISSDSMSNTQLPEPETGNI